tara:strand:- start:4623 stop:5291 length:669 start_codon:yes stop_codon:yes gene_type:complete
MTKLKISNLGIKFNLDKKRDRTLKNFLLNPFKHEKKKEFWAVRNIILELKAGDILGITGLNGSGKSTLLRAITGIYKPDEGHIESEGKISLLAIGAGFEKELTGIENIYLNGALFGFSRGKIDEILPKVLAFADIGDFIYQPIRTYSSGMESRLGFAIAINLNPDILLIDEILAVGDAEFKDKCRNEIEKILKDEQKIVLIVSHNLDLIDKLCNRKFELIKR